MRLGCLPNNSALQRRRLTTARGYGDQPLDNRTYERVSGCPTSASGGRYVAGVEVVSDGSGRFEVVSEKRARGLRITVGYLLATPRVSPGRSRCPMLRSRVIV
jgi:hypothetical protein